MSCVRLAPTLSISTDQGLGRACMQVMVDWCQTPQSPARMKEGFAAIGRAIKASSNPSVTGQTVCFQKLGCAECLEHAAL